MWFLGMDVGTSGTRAVLVDERDPGLTPRVLFYLEHSIQDASVTRGGERRVVSKRMLYVELDADELAVVRGLLERHGMLTVAAG